MKKIIIGMLLLLPLIIVASVLFAIDVITVGAYIAVDRVELNYTTLELSLSDGYFDGLKATVYPTAAKNKDVIWELSDVIPTVEYEGEIATVDEKTGRLDFYSYGTFTVIATTAEGNKKAACNVYIKGDKVQDIELTASKTSLMTGESVWLTSVFHPIDAVVKEIEWSSSAPSVIKVDGNGIATAVAPGKAVITVSTEGISKSVTLTSVQGVSYYGETVYLSSSSATLTDITPHAVSGASAGQIENGSFRFDGAGEATLYTAEGNIRLIKCDPNEIVIENAPFFAGYRFKAGKLPLVLSAAYKDPTKAPPAVVTWESSDPEIAEIDQYGRVTGHGSGFVVFTAKAGGESASIEIEIVKPISVIVLEKNAETEKRGILEKTVYGNRRYGAEGLEPEVINIGVIFPTDASPDDFIYSTDDPSLAVFAEDGKLKLIGDFSEKNTVEITLTAKVSPYESVSVYRKYTFTVGNGVNCYSYEDMRRAADEGRDIYLMSDIDFGENGRTFELRSSLYGNGYLLDGLKYASKTQDYTMLKVVGSGVTVSNIRVRGDDAERIYQPNGLRGHAITVGNRDGEFITGVRIEYSVLESGYYALSTYRAEVTVEGCIMRNTSNFGIFIESAKEGDNLIYSDVTLKNVVMSNIVAPAIGVSVSSPTDRHSTLKVKGFLDIYNWQDITAMRMLDRDIIDGDKAMNELFKNLIASALQKEFKKERYSNVRYTDETGSYLHLGIITAGALFECETVPEIEDERYEAFDIEVLHDGSLIPGLELKPVFLYNYRSANPDIKPGDAPVENKALYKKLRGGN